VQDVVELLVERSDTDPVTLGFGSLVGSLVGSFVGSLVGSGVGSGVDLYVGSPLGPIVIEGKDMENPGGPGGPPGLGGGYTPGLRGRPMMIVPLDPGGQNQHSGQGPSTGCPSGSRVL